MSRKQSNDESRIYLAFLEIRSGVLEQGFGVVVVRYAAIHIPKICGMASL